MAISWDTTGCSVPLPLNDAEAVQRDTVIFLAARVEAGDLTAATLREWMVRTLMLQRFTGMQPPFGSDEALRQSLHRWCGLTTNAAELPRGEWIGSELVGITEHIEGKVDALIDEAGTFAPMGSVGAR
jgi:hypothetical protein